MCLAHDDSTNNRVLGLDAANASRFPKKMILGTRPPRTIRAAASRSSRARRHLIQEPRDAADTAVAEYGEIRTLDRAVDAVGAESPGEADMVAKAIGLADQLEFEIRKALLHAGDERVDAVMAVA
jgi:hypothetical protein